MPPRNAKRAPAPKNRGKHNTTTRTSSAAHPHHQSNSSALNVHGSTGHTSSDIQRLRAAPTRPPPERLSKLWSASQQAPTRATADSRSHPYGLTTTGFAFARNAAAAATRGAEAPALASASPPPLPPAATAGSSNGTSASMAGGFANLSPETLAAVFSVSPSAIPSSPPASSAPPPQWQSPSSAAESSLARLRSLACGGPSLVLPSPPSRTFRNEESPLQPNSTPQSGEASSLTSSAPTTPYTPDLVRRLAELNGTPYKQALAVLHVDRLKRARANGTTVDAGAAAAAVPPPPLSPDQLSAFRHNEEEEEAFRSLERLRQRSAASLNGASSSAMNGTTVAAAASASGDATFMRHNGSTVRAADLENEEEGRDSRRPIATTATSAASSMGVTVPSRLDQLRAAGRSSASPSSLPTTPANNALLTLWPSQPSFVSSNGAAAPPMPPAEPSSHTSPASAAATSLDVTSRLALLRQRMAVSPATATQPLLSASASPPPPSQPLLAPTTQPATAASAPMDPFMNLERMRVGHGSTSTLPRNVEHPYETRYLSKDLLKSDDDSSRPPNYHNLANFAYPSSSSSTTVTGSGGGVGGRSYTEHAPPYATLNGNGSYGGRLATPPSSPVPPPAIDAVAQEAHELRQLEAHLQRYRENNNNNNNNNSVDSHNTIPDNNNSSSSAGLSASTLKPKRPVRRSQRRRLSNLVKKESAVALLVKGRRSDLQRSGEGHSLNGGLGSLPSGLSSAQMVARLRSLAAPVPVGETLKSDSDTATAAATAALPPSWSSSSPFAALASPNLYGMLHNAARDHHADPADGQRTETPSTAAANGAAGVAPPLQLYNYPSMSSPPVPLEARRLPAFSRGRTSQTSSSNNNGGSHRPLPASAQCVVFDTSSLLDSEPGVLNLLLERAHVGIPFKVLDELDYMHKGGTIEKDSAGGGGGGGGVRVVGGGHDREWRRKRAHDLRNWIASCVSAANTNLMLQKRTEVVEAYDRRTANNDDQILGYAVYLRRLREKVIFVTEDKFLRIKAAAEIGRAYSYAEVRQLVGMPAAAASSSIKRIPLRRVRGRR